MRITIDTYKARAGRLDLDGIDFDAFRTTRSPPDALRCLSYMHDVERHTMCYLRDLLVTRAHGDPEVTAFLACWGYEELWHGEAIAAVLEAHGEPAGAPAAVLAPRRRRREPSSTVTIGSAAHPAPGRRPHGVGRRQRVDDPGRVRPPGRQGVPSGAGRAPPQNHAAGGPSHRLLRGRGASPAVVQPGRPGD